MDAGRVDRRKRLVSEQRFGSSWLNEENDLSLIDRNWRATFAQARTFYSGATRIGELARDVKGGGTEDTGRSCAALSILDDLRHRNILLLRAMGARACRAGRTSG